MGANVTGIEPFWGVVLADRAFAAGLAARAMAPPGNAAGSGFAKFTFWFQ